MQFYNFFKLKYVNLHFIQWFINHLFKIITLMKKTLPILMILFVVLMPIMALSNTLNLLSNSKSDYKIIIPYNATEAEETAGHLLQEYFFKSTGVVLPLLNDKHVAYKYELCIGNTNRLNNELKSKIDNFAADEFFIDTKDEKVFFTGGTQKGVIYGVVDFIEKYLHCYLLAPNEEYITSHTFISLPALSYGDKPYNLFRNVHGWFIKNTEYKNWQRLQDVYDVFGEGYYVHTFEVLVPWTKFFKDNPAYFAYFNGKHNIDQLCLSNPEVLDRVKVRLDYEMKKQPDRMLWSVSQNDNDAYCRCEKCTRTIEEEGSPSGLILRFVNEIAKEFPDKTISTLAYSFSRHAPKITKPEKNVQIVLCTIELNRSKPIENDPTSSTFIKDIQEWSQLTDNIMIWDYTVDFAHSVYPFPNLHVLQPNIQFFNKYGVKEHFQQTNTTVGHEMSELKSYLLSKILWNPNVDVDSVKNFLLTHYFGNASNYIKEYLDLLETELIKSNEWLGIYEHPVSHENTSLSQANMDKYEALFDKAENAVKDNPTLLQRVKIARLPIQYAAMEIGKSHLLGNRGWYNEVKGDFVVKKKMTDMLEDFYKTCKISSVKTLDESGLTPKQYYEATKRFVNVQTSDNLVFRKKVTLEPKANEKYSYGDAQLLTNGVKGANDYNVHWIGWEGEDAVITVDLGKKTNFKNVIISSLYYPKSWILHPKSVALETSADGKIFNESGTINVEGNQKDEQLIKEFTFSSTFNNVRFLRFKIKGTIALPDWHYAAGGKSWFFVDEIVVN